jgi:eukaryotic-like serine/threonine-protein kinase
LAEKFDPADLRVGGEPTVLARGLTTDRLADFTVSADGLLMHRTSEQEKGVVAWHDRRGRVLETLPDAGSDSKWALSPDGSMVAIAGADESGRQTLKLRSLNDGSLRETFLQEPPSRLIWSTTSDTVYGSGRRSLISLQLPEARVVELMQSESTPEPSDVAPDGSFLVYHRRGSAGNLDVWRLPLGRGGSRPEPLVQTASDEFDARISPDGRWLAYVSKGSGQPHVTLRSLHHSGSAERKISIGLQPRWRSDGHELFYLTPAGMLMAIPVRPPSHGSPSPLFKTGIQVNATETSAYGVSLDGRRFLAPLAAGETKRQSWTVIKNWETQTAGLQ